MATVVEECASVFVPGWVKDLTSFRRWVHSNEVPENLRVCFYHGGVWIDMSKEQFYTHNQIRKEFDFAFTGLEKASKRGRFVPEGMLLSNDEVGFACQPDGVFILHDTFQTGRIRLLEGSRTGYVELEGTPDLVLEILSDSSVEKDTVTLRDLYWQAGVAEYWLVDARGDRLVFDILRHTEKGYVPAPKRGGWVKSNVFGKSFRLTCQDDADGNPEYTLEVR